MSRPNMLTRGRSMKEMELQLREALSQLSKSKILVTKLMTERDESESEITSIVNKNAELKAQLADLDIKFMDCHAERDVLLNSISEMDECRQQYDQMLLDVQQLQRENQLKDQKIGKLKGEIDRLNLDITLNLGNSVLNSKSANSFKYSRNHQKKIAKLNKIFCKAKKSIKNINLSHRLESFKNEHTLLKQQLYDLHKQNENLNLQHKLHVKELSDKIVVLYSDLELSNKQYENAQEIINTQTSKIDEIIEMSKYNEKCFNSLVNSGSGLCKCNCSVSMESSTVNLDLTTGPAEDNIVSSNLSGSGASPYN